MISHAVFRTCWRKNEFSVNGGRGRKGVTAWEICVVGVHWQRVNVVVWRNWMMSQFPKSLKRDNFNRISSAHSFVSLSCKGKDAEVIFTNLVWGWSRDWCMMFYLNRCFYFECMLSRNGKEWARVAVAI